MMIDRPTHHYIARKPCGCCMAICGDAGMADTYESLAEWVRDGYRVERIPREQVRAVLDEPTFMACNHGQLALFVERRLL